MFSKRAILALLAMALVLGQAGRILAADVLEAIPSDAIAVVLINRLEATSDKIEKLAAKVQAPSVSLLMLARVQTGIHEGLDEKATGALALLPSENFPQEPPVPIVLLPVTDYAKFVAQLQPDDPTEKITQVYVAGKPMMVCQKGEFAVLTSAQGEATLKDVLASVKSVSADLAPLKTWLSEVDAAAVATPAAIKTVSAMARDQLADQIERFEAQAAGNAELAPVLTMLKIYHSIFAAAGDQVNLAAIGIKSDDNDTVRLTTRVRLAPDSDWAKTAEAMSAPAKNLLTGLPSGPFVAAGGMQYNEPLKQLSRWVIQGDMLKANPKFAKLPPEKLAKWTELNARMIDQVEAAQFWLGPAKADQPLLAGAMIMAKVTGAKKYLADFEEVRKQIFDGEVVRHFQVDGCEASEMVTDVKEMIGLEDSAASAALKPLMAKLLGSDDKLHAFMAVVDERTVVTTYSEDQLFVAIAAAKGNGKSADGKSGDGPQSSKVFTMLPLGSQAVALVTPGGVAQIVQALQSMGSKAKVADFPDSPPIGAALKVSSSGLLGEVVVPGETLQAIGKFVAEQRGGR